MGGDAMLLGVALGDSYGAHPGAWRMPHTNPNAYTDVEVQVRAAQTAERGGLDYAFYPDRVFLQGDLLVRPPIFSMEPLMVLAAVAHATRRIGLVASSSTAFNEPYTLARQLRALDLMSHGRAGWNAIPSYEPEAFANYGRQVPQRDEKYERLHEVVQITQALWGSWEREAGQPDQTAGRFADPSHIRPVNLQGRRVGARGPLQIPPSEQGQPVIFMPSASGLGLQAAGMYANGIIAMPSTIEESRAQRDMIRSLAEAAGRTADEVKFLAFVTFGLGATEQEAVERRMVLEQAAGLEGRLAHLSAVLGLRLDPADADKPLTSSQVRGLRPSPGVPQAARAVELASQGLSPREILAHGVLDALSGLVGTPEQAADRMQEWIQAGVCDGFTLVVDDLHDGLDAFVDQVVPILRRRGLRPDNYLGATLRDHLSLPEQLGLDPRLASDN
ncbi:NtaA/DmoA family FMN-dependent monooxygenase [Rhodococcus sp. DMU1]|uniref:NtaA/DmoA family FMN-dependent monooxygenase n=1 Tax=Rhodococcus sp. DMU1 TaxID=2722825 RepID=UPI00143E5C1B|nr:NtaA/DmoA family FMN-dependent monooxygenase [Rhodococcus sp. DMU1]QIX53677.1 NtaA/DmoA family FMN-dependent monooxygenase [Rhodococcus sp. DMU1]